MRVKEGENTMGNYTREEVLQMAEDEDVEFIRLQFTDMYGAIKNIAVTTRELPRALDNQCIVNGEQIAGKKKNCANTHTDKKAIIRYPTFDFFIHVIPPVMEKFAYISI